MDLDHGSFNLYYGYSTHGTKVVVVIFDLKLQAGHENMKPCDKTSPCELDMT